MASIQHPSKTFRRFESKSGASGGGFTGTIPKKVGGNPACIDIPKGRYTLSFAEVTASAPADSKGNRPVLRYLAIAGIVIVVGAGGLFIFNSDRATAPDAIAPRFTESAEAYSMFFEARNIGNPPVIKARVEAALDLARAIQRMDPEFGGGYAAESMQLWNYVLFGHSDAPKADGARAIDLARRAIEFDPEFSWGHHALAQALHLSGDVAGAIEENRHAVDLNPDEPDHRGYLGLFLALAGRGSEGIEQLATALELTKSVRSPYRNLLGIVYYHDRQFAKAAEIIGRNREIGGPSGPHMLLYLAAAHALAGHKGQAAAIAQLIRNDETGFVPMTFIDRLFEIPAERDLLLDGLSKAGLSGEDLEGKTT